MGKPTSENQLTVLVGDAIRMAHRKVDTGTLLNTVIYNSFRGRIFSPLCFVDLPPCYLHLMCLHSSLLHNPQQFSRWNDSSKNTCGNKLQIYLHRMQ